MTQNNITVPVPEWVRKRALPQVGEAPDAIVLMKRDGLRKSALLFTENGTYVVEKRFLKGLKLYKADYPASLLLHDGNCPHCGKSVLAPIPPTVPESPAKAVPSRRARRTRRSTPYRYHGYTLHKVNRGRRGTGYFFAKKKPKRGTAIAKPRGYRVKETKSGLPVLTKA